MWVAVTAATTVYRIGSRRKEELTALIGEAFLGWLVTDGYGAYRDHPRRQRCLAHLIRKALALAEGYYGAGSGFGRDLVRDLRRLIERVHDGDGDTDAVKRLMARIKWNCQRNRHEIEQKVRDLAGEILNDWDAVIAFVSDPSLPPSRVDDWRGGGESRGVAVVRRLSPVAGASVRSFAPFPVAARQTVQADFPHTAFTHSIKPSLWACRRGARGYGKARASHAGSSARIAQSRVRFSPCAASTSVAVDDRRIGGSGHRFP
jgi:hypothetical protein